MPEITFQIEDESYGVTVNTIDPNELYSSGDQIEKLVEEAGFEFKTGEVPDRAELSLLGRESEGSDIELGDLTPRVKSKKVDDSPVPDGDVSVRLISPGGNEESATFNDGQNLGAVAAWIQLNRDVSMDKEIKLYKDEGRSNVIDRGRMVSEVDGETLYWDAIG